ncbi:hypothetical protein HanIR_Chr02g0065201 [Helianthus annuus]|nr:hypothetical protein HanIR_Chr02g0065201 [Helianthus annuus]
MKKLQFHHRHYQRRDGKYGGCSNRGSWTKILTFLLFFIITVIVVLISIDQTGIGGGRARVPRIGSLNVAMLVALKCIVSGNVPDSLRIICRDGIGVWFRSFATIYGYSFFVICTGLGVWVGMYGAGSYMSWVILW